MAPHLLSQIGQVLSPGGVVSRFFSRRSGCKEGYPTPYFRDDSRRQYLHKCAIRMIYAWLVPRKYGHDETRDVGQNFPTDSVKCSKQLPTSTTRHPSRPRSRKDVKRRDGRAKSSRQSGKPLFLLKEQRGEVNGSPRVRSSYNHVSTGIQIYIARNKAPWFLKQSRVLR